MTGNMEQIMGILEPKVGHSLAESLLRIKCRKLGIAMDKIPADTIPVLADDLFEPLSIFAGPEFAQALTTRIKAIAS
jgi:hypothetical protein